MKSTYTFSPDGSSLSLQDPAFIEQADFDLWNDQFTLYGDQNGSVRGHVYTPNAQIYSEDTRPVYLLDLEEESFRSLTHRPVFEDTDAYRFTIALDHLTWETEKQGLSGKASVAVPREGALEAWTVSVRNNTNRTRRIAVIPAIPTGLLGLLSQESAVEADPFGLRIDYVPYYVKIPDYAKIAARWNTTFLYPDRAPESWTCLERDFLGPKWWTRPVGLFDGSLHHRHCHYERGIFALRYEAELAPGERFDLSWIMGPARNPEHAREMLDAYPPAEAWKKALHEQRDFRSRIQIPLQVELPDKEFQHYMNHWSPDRSIRIGRTLRFNPAPQARNAIQDTMTLALFDPEKARVNFNAIWAHQEKSGFMPHGLPMVEGAELMPITLIPHKDTNIWGPLALDVYIRESGDAGILEDCIPYKDGPGESLAEHLERGLRWLLEERSPRGLSLIGQGDWNDPLNMAGPEGKGESVWLSEALVVALESWNSICERTGRSTGDWHALAEEIREAIRAHAWDGEWFVRAFSDEGKVIGANACEEGRIFLNAQSWAIMAGVPDEKQVRAMIASVNTHLGNRIAPPVLAPPYRGMRDHVGKLTLKSPGTGENASIYSHAALFWSYALLRSGRTEDGWRVLRNLLPGSEGNPVESCGQLPLYIPNFYRGPVHEDVFGRSSHSPNTGSAAWVYMTFIEEVVGLKGDGTRLLVQPRLPAEWNAISGERLYQGTRYTFSMSRKPGLGQARITVDGEASDGRIPVDGAKAQRSIVVELP